MIRQMTDVTDLNNVLITETIREQKVYVAFPGTCVRDHTAERAPQLPHHPSVSVRQQKPRVPDARI